MNKLTTAEFIKKSNKIHGKYNYTKTVYVLSSVKVTIICPEHGEFQQTPNSHLKGSGCPKCSKNSKKDYKYYINIFNKIHNNKYKYEGFTLGSANDKIKIHCPLHGWFTQKISNHQSGQGCPRCNNKIMDTNEFIRKANNTHKYKYDYSKVNYIDSITKITIICPEHGDFTQTPNKHLMGGECPSCTYDGRLIVKEKRLKEFNEVHNNEYKYPKNQSFDSLNNIIAICKHHGEFTIGMYSHLNGAGCPKCQKLYPKKPYYFDLITRYSKYPKLGKKLGYFYILKFTHKVLKFEFIKVGVTSKSIEERYKYYGDYDYKIIKSWRMSNIKTAILERRFHKNTKLKKFEFPEGIVFRGYTECYKIK